jgi:hypothetical protein
VSYALNTGRTARRTRQAWFGRRRQRAGLTRAGQPLLICGLLVVPPERMAAGVEDQAQPEGQGEERDDGDDSGYQGWI